MAGSVPIAKVGIVWTVVRFQPRDFAWAFKIIVIQASSVRAEMDIRY